MYVERGWYILVPPIRLGSTPGEEREEKERSRNDDDDRPLDVRPQLQVGTCGACFKFRCSSVAAVVLFCRLTSRSGHERVVTR